MPRVYIVCRDGKPIAAYQGTYAHRDAVKHALREPSTTGWTRIGQRDEWLGTGTTVAVIALFCYDSTPASRRTSHPRHA